ncbi:hypothetical protein CX676_08275 [Paracoccus zhejiangensis]|uniref:Uncharacterized protein n=1 Tax=Paracoccus zhejiangensis TaxID=1077935 RepID=A0A2H5EXY1_9RHOB|nr:hypothetical protein CX676_08275 [Paracoccus zhejiangensis]
MLATVLHGPGDIRFERVEDPKILKPTDAIIQLSATCICGSDLWPYRGLQPQAQPMHMGHECAVSLMRTGLCFCWCAVFRLQPVAATRPVRRYGSV